MGFLFIVHIQIEEAMCLFILKNGKKCLSSTVSDRDYFSTTFSTIEINFPGTFGHNALHILFNPHDVHQVFLHAGEDRSLCSSKKN